MRLPARTPLSRRGALAAGAVVVAAGCDPQAPSAPSGQASSAPANVAPSDQGDPGDQGDQGDQGDLEEGADLELLDEVRRSVVLTLALVEVARDRHPSLRGSLRPIALVHRVHARELAATGRGARAAGGGARRVPGDPARTLARVRAREERLQGELTAAAIQARSGGFARLVGSMAASVAQHLTNLPAGPAA